MMFYSSEYDGARKWSCKKGTIRYDFSIFLSPFLMWAGISPSIMMIRRRTRRNRKKKNNRRRKRRRRRTSNARMMMVRVFNCPKIFLLCFVTFFASYATYINL